MKVLLTAVGTISMFLAHTISLLAHDITIISNEPTCALTSHTKSLVKPPSEESDHRGLSRSCAISWITARTRWELAKDECRFQTIRWMGMRLAMHLFMIPKYVIYETLSTVAEVTKTIVLGILVPPTGPALSVIAACHTIFEQVIT